MKLRLLIRICLAGTVAGLLVLAVLAFDIWRGVSRSLDHLDRIGDLQVQVGQLVATVDYATLVRGTRLEFSALNQESKQLANALGVLDHGGADRAARHLEELATISALLVDRLESAAPDATIHDGADGLFIAQQLRIHLHGVQEALESVFIDSHNDVFAGMKHAITLFVVGSIGFAVLSVLAVGLLQRRVSRPVRAIEDGLRAYAAGNTAVRIDVKGRDELSDLAKTFNDMVVHRGEQDVALHESEERFRTLLNDIPSVAIQGYAFDGSVTYWNHASEVFYGYSRQEAIGGNLLDLIIPPGMRDEVCARLEALRERGEPIPNGELHLMRKGGDPVIVYSCHTVVRRARHAPELFRIDIDLSERVALEDRLRQAQRLEAVGLLTGGIAHDFNNLLQVIQGNTEMLVDRLADQPRLLALARLMEQAAQRGATLTARLLAFARRQTLSPRPTDVHALLQDMLELLRRTLGEHIAITIEPAPAQRPALIDPSQLENAILNLCINARDAMPNGGDITLAIKEVELDEEYASRNAEVRPGPYVMVSVSDSGIGMDSDTLARAFDPFYTTKLEGKGTGLGLSMVHGFIKQSDGHIRLYSEPGQGTIVRLYLPLADRSSTTVDGASTGQSREPVGNGQESVLVVEDDDLVREHVTEQLRSLNYQVVVATDGVEALALLAEGARCFDLLFTDVVMPGGVNGRQLASAARRICPEMPVLFTSGYAQAGLTSNGTLEPGVHLLSKPYRRVELAVAVRNAIDRADSGPEAAL